MLCVGMNGIGLDGIELDGMVVIRNRYSWSTTGAAVPITTRIHSQL